MPQIDTELSTGLAGLDRLLTGLIPGDNVVWQVASLEDYLPFVKPYCQTALARGSPTSVSQSIRRSCRPGPEPRSVS